eukprot:snap_masked-scaffold_16-processed-gene-2.18-mRNA-1 protein AED:0.34 eAED:0.35 QI:0/-1/0/1/-1/1/1/0/214
MLPSDTDDEQADISLPKIDGLDATSISLPNLDQIAQASSSRTHFDHKSKQKVCIHGRTNNGYFCKECPGKGICEHLHQKYSCKRCKGSSVCPHGKQKHYCKICRPNYSKNRKSKVRERIMRGTPTKRRKGLDTQVSAVLEGMVGAVEIKQYQADKIQQEKYEHTGRDRRELEYENIEFPSTDFHPRAPTPEEETVVDEGEFGIQKSAETQEEHM